MTSPTGSQRPLFFPLNTTEEFESPTPNTPALTYVDLSAWPEPDPDIRINILMNLSLNEYVALASTIDVGRDIAYGDNSNYIWWLWTRILTSMDLCDAIINCIETTPELRQTIINTTQGLPDTPQSPNQYQQDVFEPVMGCNPDEIYGYCRALWTYINANNIDFLQQISEATNLTESIDRLLRLIPGFEQLPVSEVLQWISALGDYNLEAYEASITVAIEDKIVCDLMCIALNNDCHLTFEQVYNYLVDRFGGAGALNLGATFSELVIFMVTGSYPSDKIVFLWSIVQLGFAFIGSTFLGINSVAPYAIQARAGISDDAWEEICDECVETWTSQWLGGNGDPVTDAWVKNYGTYDAMEDTITGVSASDAKYIELVYTFDETVTITGISFTLDIKSPTAGNNIIYIRNASNTIIQSTTVSVVESSITERIIAWSGSQSVDTGWKIVIASNARILAQSPSNVMKAITVAGEGTNPFI